jgi:uncharacterized protein YjaZ
MSVDIHFLNATGVLDHKVTDISHAFRTATRRARKLLGLKDADVIVSGDPSGAIPELGVGGYTDAASKSIYVSIDPKAPLTVRSIEACLDHEYYHLVHHQRVGVPLTLRDRAIDEGLACLYELETTGELPLYAKQRLADDHLKLFIKHADDTSDTDRWFFGGDSVPRWFAYSLGFRSASSYAGHVKKSASQLVGTKNSIMYDSSLGSTKLPRAR